MNKIKIFLPVFLQVVVGMLALSSCEKEQFTDQEFTDNIHETEEVATKENAVVLGNQINDPYSVKNMRQALEKLQEEGKANGKSEIEPTHFYVRFLAENYQDIDLLEADGIPLYDYPLDFEIVEGGTYYFAPETIQNDTLWLYSVVETTYEFPALQYEVLYEVYIPGEDEAYLEQTAYEIAGHSEQIEKGPLYTPNGVVEVWSTISNGLVGVNNVKVDARWGTKIATGYTNSSGSFSVNKQFRYNVYFSVKFKNSQVRTWRYHSAGQIAINGGRKTLNYDIYRNSNEKVWTWATTVNAVADYYDLCNQLNINTPPTNLKISTIAESVGGGACPMFSKTGTMTNMAKLFTLRFNINAAIASLILQYVMPDIIVARHSTTISIYQVLYHELSHASHYTQVGKWWWRALIAYELGEIIKSGGDDPYGNGTAYNAGYCAVAESWAYHMENILLWLDGYNRPNGQNPRIFIENNPFFENNWIPQGVYYDIWDVQNPNEQDNVNGGNGNIYSTRQMFLCLTPSVKNMNNFQNLFINTYGSNQEQEIEELFFNYGF